MSDENILEEEIKASSNSLTKTVKDLEKSSKEIEKLSVGSKLFKDAASANLESVKAFQASLKDLKALGKEISKGFEDMDQRLTNFETRLNETNGLVKTTRTLQIIILIVVGAIIGYYIKITSG